MIKHNINEPSASFTHISCFDWLIMFHMGKLMLHLTCVILWHVLTYIYIYIYIYICMPYIHLTIHKTSLLEQNIPEPLWAVFDLHFPPPFPLPYLFTAPAPATSQARSHIFCIFGNPFSNSSFDFGCWHRCSLQPAALFGQHAHGMSQICARCFNQRTTAKSKERFAQAALATCAWRYVRNEGIR